MERNIRTPSPSLETPSSGEHRSLPDPFAETLVSAVSAALPRLRSRGEDAEDIGQDAALAVWERRAQLETLSRAKLTAYTVRTVVNKGHDADRRNLRRNPTAGSGWYLDPDSGSRLRYWDGSRWTDRVRDAQGESRSEPSERASHVLPRDFVGSTEYLDEHAGDSWQPTQWNRTEETVMAHALRNEINQIVDELPPRQALIVRMQISGYSHHQMAEVLKTTPGAANSLRLRARAQIRTRLEQQGLL